MDIARLEELVVTSRHPPYSWQFFLVHPEQVAFILIFSAVLANSLFFIFTMGWLRCTRTFIFFSDYDTKADVPGDQLIGMALTNADISGDQDLGAVLPQAVSRVSWPTSESANIVYAKCSCIRDRGDWIFPGLICSIHCCCRLKVVWSQKSVRVPV